MTASWLSRDIPSAFPSLKQNLAAARQAAVEGPCPSSWSLAAREEFELKGERRRIHNLYLIGVQFAISEVWQLSVQSMPRVGRVQAGSQEGRKGVPALRLVRPASFLIIKSRTPSSDVLLPACKTCNTTYTTYTGELWRGSQCQQRMQKLTAVCCSKQLSSMPGVPNLFQFQTRCSVNAVNKSVVTLLLHNSPVPAHSACR